MTMLRHDVVAVVHEHEGGGQRPRPTRPAEAPHERHGPMLHGGDELGGRRLVRFRVRVRVWVRMRARGRGRTRGRARVRAKVRVRVRVGVGLR